MIAWDEVTRKFVEAFDAEPTWTARAPGRVNLIGDHTDYNGGFVLPAAIDREVRIAARPRGDRRVRLVSTSYAAPANIDLDKLEPPTGAAGWSRYFHGVAEQLELKGLRLPGLDIVVASDIPFGAGLSSSAAFEVGVITLFNAIVGGGLSPREVALLGQSAEHGRFVRVNCGIMDQYASALGCAGHALMIDCHTLMSHLVPIDSSSVSLMIVDSNKKRSLGASEYNTRCRECEAALVRLGEAAGQMFPSLRHIPAAVLDRHGASLEENLHRRVRHNLTENARVLAFAKAMAAGDFATAGRLVNESHASLRDDYQTSCEELDFIVAKIQAHPAAYGSRITGGGFGGCAVALVKPGTEEAIFASFAASYRERFGAAPSLIVSQPAEGASAQAIEATSALGVNP